MGKHFDFYTSAIKSGDLGEQGLCGVADAGKISKHILDLFIPSDEDIDELVAHYQLLSYYSEGYWGSGVELGHPDRATGFTTLRQTIVLFMAAINNEL